MGVFTERPISSLFRNVDNFISGLSERTMPWECGLILLQDEKAGLSPAEVSPALQTFTRQAIELHRIEAGNTQAWNSLIDQVRACDWNQPFSPVENRNGELKWSEHAALGALVEILRAAVSKLEGNGKEWRSHMVQAALNLSSYYGGIARARVIRPPAPSAPLYDDRVKEMAEVDRYRRYCERVGDESDDRTFLRQQDIIGKIYRKTVDAEKAARIAAEKAEAERVRNLPFYRRWPLELARNWRTV